MISNPIFTVQFGIGPNSFGLRELAHCIDKSACVNRWPTSRSPTIGSNCTVRLLKLRRPLMRN
jgi:hypothetical protein